MKQLKVVCTNMTFYRYSDSWYRIIIQTNKHSPVLLDLLQTVSVVIHNNNYNAVKEENESQCNTNIQRCG